MALTATEYLLSKMDALRTNQVTHYAACERLLRRHRTVGLSLVAFSTLALGLTFADPAEVPYQELLTPALSIVVALLSAMATFMGNQELATEHKAAAVAYGTLLRECEARTTGAVPDEDNANFIPEFLQRWAAISSASPLTALAERRKVKLIQE